MKRIGLLRHAQAEPKAARGDFDRILSERGRAEMEVIAARFEERGLGFEVALVSPAARTRETWERAGRPDIPVRFERAIYDAPVEALMAILRGLDDAVGSVVVVGHNPGLEEFADLLVPGGQGLPGSFPTAGLAVISLPIDAWAALEGASGSLDLFVSPS